MPELPEVETIRRAIGPELCGRVVVEAGAHPSAKFQPALEVAGARFGGATRRGKYLLLSLDDDRELIVHLGMTGQLRFATEHDDYVRAWWRLDDDRELQYRDIRRFGRLRVVPAGNHRGIGTLASMGPEPFDPAFTPDSLWNAMRASNRRLKTQLLSQRPVAGLGNIYADEACWLAGVHPGARRLSRPRAERLHEAIVTVLAQGVANGGTTLRDYRALDGTTGDNQSHLRCYGRAGEPCERCGTELRSIVLDARTTTFCPTCQRR